MFLLDTPKRKEAAYRLKPNWSHFDPEGKPSKTILERMEFILGSKIFNYAPVTGNLSARRRRM